MDAALNKKSFLYPNTTVYFKIVRNRNMTTVCEQYKYLKGGVIFLDRITKNFPLMVVFFPMVLVIFFSFTLEFLLKPFGEASFVSQVLGGIALGPSLLTRSNVLRQLIFPPKVINAIGVIECLGLIFMFFTLSARIDKGIVRKSGTLGIALGVGAFFIPMAITTAMTTVIKNGIDIEEQLRSTLPMVATLEATTSFHVILAQLTELKLLNSEIGRLALSSSLLSTLIGWFVPTIFVYANELGDKEPMTAHQILMSNLSVVIMVIIIVFAVRPVIFWMVRRTPEGKPLAQGNIVAVNVIVLVLALVGELTGQNGYLGPFILGIITPVEPPMGPLLVDKIEYFVWTALIPCFMINTGRRVDLFKIKQSHFAAIELTILISGCAKIFAIVIPCLYSRIPLMDSLALALILNCRGLYDVQVFTRAKQRGQITDESFAIMVVTAMLQSAVVLPLVKLVYDSSKRYAAFRKRTIQNCEHHAELRILACINQIENVPTIINTLEVLNPPQCNIAVYVMNLEEYVGQSMPVVIPHRLDKPQASKPSKIDHIINALYSFQQSNSAFASVQCFTAVAPYASMHDDICTMAFQKGTSIIIFPFQKTGPPSIRKVIDNVLEMSPCTIGILYDRGVFMDFRPIFSRQTTIDVCMFFIGGPDDREALALASRMARHRGVMLTVLRFMVENNSLRGIREKNLDQEMIADFRMSHIDHENLEYVEEKVEEGSDTAKIMNTTGCDFDLIIVGRRHIEDTAALQGLEEWKEIEELGVVGDLLASEDFKGKASVMVIQQQAYSLSLEPSYSLAPWRNRN